MSIELLWIVPIVSAAFVIFILVVNIQKSKEDTTGSVYIRDLKREVDEFNRGIPVDTKLPLISEENRLSKIESTIQLVSTALSNQQKMIENFQGKDDILEDGLNDLKEKLKELQKEYDITISENYSLRARLNKVEKERGKVKNSRSSTSSGSDIPEDTDTIEVSKVLNMKIYEEDRKLDPTKPSELDDTSEINLSELQS